MSTHGPVSEAYRKRMNALARLIDEYFNGDLQGDARTAGFALLVFPFGPGNPSRDRINYISNTNRVDMIIAMKELVARFEGHDHAEEGHA